MNLSIIAFFIFAACLTGGQVWATPPSSFTATYDPVAQKIHISAAHPSDKLDKHYLRRIVILRNGKEDKSVNFVRQKLASGLEEDIIFEGQDNDQVKVDVYCSQGGTASATFVVPAKEEVAGHDQAK